jgi:hypothetical protein
MVLYNLVSVEVLLCAFAHFLRIFVPAFSSSPHESHADSGNDAVKLWVFG